MAWVAGLSIASVSRVLNGQRNPRPETRDRVLQAVAELGFVPDSVAVTGFDDMPVARHLHPLLTSVRQSIQDLGATAFETVFSMISRAVGSDNRGRDITLPTQVVRRESCGCGGAGLPGRA